MRWARLLGITLLFAALWCVGAVAAVTSYDAAVRADGVTLGTASGTLDVTRGADGRITWTLSDGRFTPATLPHAAVVFDAANLAGSGTAADAATVALKEFNATVAQSTGVDVTYRFEFTVTLEDGAVRNVSIHQMK